MEQTTPSKELLCEIYRNVTMGNENLANVVPKIRNKFLLTNVTCQMEQYAHFTNRAYTLLRKSSVQPPRPSATEKLASKANLALSTLFDSTDAHLAHWIEKGSRQGANDLERSLCRAETGTVQKAPPDVVSLAKEVVAFERTEADKMRDFT